jgi:5-formyltetrahydrofolate cyclo-ligase
MTLRRDLLLTSSARLAVSAAARPSARLAAAAGVQRRCMCAAASAGAPFDAAAFDADRLAKDEDARADMMAAMQQAPGAWKWAIRKRIWDTLEATNVADNPRPVHHRIPNFKQADAAAARLAALPEFQAAHCVKARAALEPDIEAALR